MSLFPRSRSIGLAVGRHAVTAVVPGSAARPERVEVALEAGAADASAVLEAAFLELARRLEHTHGRPTRGWPASVALLPSLADVRLLTLPPLRRSELEAVVRRDAARHFVGGGGPRVIGVLPPGGRGKGPGPILAAAAPAPLLEALRRAVSAAGWRLESVVPAQTAWWAAGLRGRNARGLVVAVDGATAYVLRVEDGAPVSLRRVPIGLSDELAAAAGEGRGPAVVFGDHDRVESVVGALARGGWKVSALVEPGATAAEAAARHAHSAGGPELEPPSLSQERRSRGRRAAAHMTGLAAALVALTAAVHLWGVKRELSAVRALREDIRDEVAPLLAAQDSLDALEARMRAIDEITDRSPRWTRALYDLAMLLPRDAWLTSLVASGDTVEIEGAAGRAGAAIEALKGAASLRDVELLGTIERELQDGETVVERFRVGARLAPPGGSEGEVPENGAGDTGEVRPGTSTGAADPRGPRPDPSSGAVRSPDRADAGGGR